MERDARLKMLATLAASDSPEALVALKRELARTLKSLSTDSQYDRLESSLEVLKVIAFRFGADVTRILQSFISEIEGRPLTYSEELNTFKDRISEYQNAGTLIVDALDVLIGIRYHEIDDILITFVGLAKHTIEEVREKAYEGLRSLARFNI